MSYRFRMLAETVTRDGNGETVEGSNGVLDSLGEYVPMEGYTGSIAAKVLEDNTFTAATPGDVLDAVGPVDHTEWRGDDEAIFYLAGETYVADDVPYLRAIWMQGPDLREAVEGVTA